MISVILDTETTGLDPHNDRIVELAILVTDGKVMMGVLSTLINPQIAFDNAVNGLSLQDVIEKPTFKELCNLGLPYLFSIADEFIGHVLDFDLRFLRAEFSYLGLQFPTRQSYDTFRLTKKNLQESCSNANVDTKDITWHSALGDAVATWRLARRLRQGQGKDIGTDPVTLGVRLS